MDKALAVGNQLEVEAISEYKKMLIMSRWLVTGRNDPCHVCPFPSDGTRHTVLTPSLAAQCGYSMESDPWGNTRIYTSLMACYVDNKVLIKLFNGFN